MPTISPIVIANIADGIESRVHASPTSIETPTRGLSLNTTDLPGPSPHNVDPLTTHTLFEDDSPLLHEASETAPDTPTPGADQTFTLSPAKYQVPGKSGKVVHTAGTITQVAPAENDHHAAFASRATVSGDFSREQLQAAETVQAGTDGVSEIDPIMPRSVDNIFGERWNLGNEPDDQGSIRIMLDDAPNFSQRNPLWSHDSDQRLENQEVHAGSGTTMHPDQDSDLHSYSNVGYVVPSSDTLHSIAPDNAILSTTTPRKRQRETLRLASFHPDSAYVPPNDSLASDSTISRVLNYYQSTGTLTDEMLQEMQQHVDLNRMSANGGSDAMMVQSLLESILATQKPKDEIVHRELLIPSNLNMPSVTPDTPVGEEFVPGTVTVFSQSTPTVKEEDSFEDSIRRADEEWERQRNGHDLGATEAVGFTPPPPPPPKDVGYTPRSSAGANSTVFPSSHFREGLRISTSSQNVSSERHSNSSFAPQDQQTSAQENSAPTSAQALPPPTPVSPPEPVLRQPFSAPDFSAMAFNDTDAGETSPNAHKSPWAVSQSSRNSFDGQSQQTAVPGAQSTTSFGDTTTRQGSFETDIDREKLAKTTSPAAPAPEQKRLSKRRHIIKELIDTENSYHQDLKIIEDIYKATCTPELVAPEDKKILFGNCDEIEKFAIYFYDELRKAATQVYVPPKSQRWGTRRNSFSTTQSDNTTNAFTDAVDDEKDRTSLIGSVFLANMVTMEQVYGTYLKNHDAANQRLAALQGTPTVKCWLDECHANASDITAAWDLDSLLVKPTQRVAKYPMLLQQLLETTPADHPDHENLKTAVKDSIAMLTRINDAKKRADLVDSIVNGRRRKESDLRGGLVKAFGRRTDRLKERVGLQEAFQDPDFDDLAHKFGGHFIRLQICMRDVQDYMNRTDKAVEIINNYASALELFTDVAPSSLPEIESKWRRYGQTIRDLNLVAFTEHKTAVQKRVLTPMIACIKLHEGPQNAIAKRKKRIVDYAKCKGDEKRGIKPDKKTLEAAEIYVALNDQLKIELPKLYSLTASLVQRCLHCFLDIQLQWNSTWERKLRPLLEASDIPVDVSQIEHAFKADYGEIERKCMELSVCNGNLKREAMSYLSPSATGSESIHEKRRTSTLDGSKRTMSVGSESSTNPHSRRHSGIYTPGMDVQYDYRLRSDSQLSGRQQSYSSTNTNNNNNRPWSNSTATNTPNSTFPPATSRPSTSNQSHQPYNPSQPYSQSHSQSHSQRQSADVPRSPRPLSGGTAYYTPRLDADNGRFSGIFNSAVPPDVLQSSSSNYHDNYASAASISRPASPPKTAPRDTRVLFVCASLFEFSIDKTRREGGYPYLTYVQGEVFDVIAQKGELWLAKNQDDDTNSLGWIWEQHFVILSSEG
jgi:hypothetical protein